VSGAAVPDDTVNEAAIRMALIKFGPSGAESPLGYPIANVLARALAEAGLLRHPADQAVTPETVWVVWKQSDLTEGRGPMVQQGGYFLTEQEAWDSINERGGVQGSHCRNFTWGKDLPDGGRPQTWQQFKIANGYGGDYDVRPIH
jgi:hypothetical protein